MDSLVFMLNNIFFKINNCYDHKKSSKYHSCDRTKRKTSLFEFYLVLMVFFLFFFFRTEKKFKLFFMIKVQQYSGLYNMSQQFSGSYNISHNSSKVIVPILSLISISILCEQGEKK